MHLNSKASFAKSTITFAQTIVKSYTHSVFALVMLMVAILTGAIGLSAVLGLQQVNAPPNAQDTWADLSQYHVVSSIENSSQDSLLTVDDYRLLKSQVALPMVGFTSFALPAKDSMSSQGQDEQPDLTLIGLDTLAMIGANAFLALSPEQQGALSGAGLAGNRIIMHPNTRKLYHKNGESILDLLSTVLIKNKNNNSIRPEIITLEAIPEGQVMIDFGLLANQYNPIHTNQLDGVMVVFAGYSTTEVTAMLPSHLMLQSPSSDFTASELSNSFQLNLLAMGLLMFAVCLFIVINATNLLLHKRHSMLLVLRQLGFSRRVVVLVQLTELIMITLLCACIGTLIGYELVKLLTQALQNVLYVDTRLTPSLVQSIVLVSLISVLGVVAACVPRLVQLKHALGHGPGNSSSQASANASANSLTNAFLGLSWDSILLMVSVGLLIVSGILFTQFDTLVFKLVGTASVILGCSVLMVACLPYVLRGLSACLASSLLQKVMRGFPHKSQLSFRIDFEMKAAQALTNQTRLAFCAFFIAVTSNIAMNVMVDSFRGATVQWLDQRLTAEHYLYVQELSATQFYSTIAQSNAQSSLLTRLIPRYVSEQSFLDTPIQVYSYPTTPQFIEAMAFEIAQDNVWQRFTQNNSVLVNQQFAYGNGLSLGDEITLTDPVTETPIRRTIDGVFYDYGNPRGQVLMPLAHFSQQAEPSKNAIPVDVFALTNLTDNEIDVLQRALDDNDINHRLFATDELLTLSMQEFDNTFIITDALNFITLLVAALSLGSTVSVLLDNSKAQRFLLRSLGFSSGGIMWASLAQYTLLIGLACIFAIPAGVMIGWLLIFEINFTAFYWTYPMQVLWGSIIPVIGLTLLAVIVVVLLPLNRARSQRIAQELAWLD